MTIKEFFFGLGCFIVFIVVVEALYLLTYLIW